MSYCKFGADSDVYLYSSTQHPDSAHIKSDVWVLLAGAGEQQPEMLPTPRAAYDRLLSLRSEGKRVPEAALERLQEEMSARRRKIVRISPQLLYELLTPSPAVQMRCTKGLPANATFIGMTYDLERDCYGLCFESDEREPVPFNEFLPTQDVRYARFRLAPFLDKAASMLADAPESPERDA